MGKTKRRQKKEEDERTFNEHTQWIASLIRSTLTIERMPFFSGALSIPSFYSYSPSIGYVLVHKILR